MDNPIVKVATAPDPQEVKRRRAKRGWAQMKAAEALGLRTVAEVRQVVHTSSSAR
jgi:DNA-binding XRE family transcriptional regulator